MPPSIHEGLAHHQAGRHAEAERIYREILASNPNDADVLHLLGVIAYDFRQYEQAAQLIGRSVQLNPNFPMSHNNLGNVLAAMKRRADAAACYERAIELKDDYAEAWNNLGTLYRNAARFGEAINAYRRAIEINPRLVDAHSNLGTTLNTFGEVEQALISYRRALEIDSSNRIANANLLYVMHFHDENRDALFREHTNWGRRFADPVTARAKPHTNTRDAERRLRIGYISPDFRDHPVARFFWPLIEHRQPERFEVFCYSNVEEPDAITRHYAAAVDGFHSIVTMSDAEAAELIRSQQIDLLIDLAGHTNGGRVELFALKPAPVQITYLGYPDTVGMRAMNYRISDALVDPAGAEQRHVEELARIDGCFLAYVLADDLPDVSCLPAIANGYITFGSFNNHAKISPATLNLWAGVLSAVPRSRMIIKDTSMGDEPTRVAAWKKFTAAGLPADRIELLGPEPSHSAHLMTYHRIDIALDTFPYAGTTTTCEALSMGVPVVSLVGDHHCARVGLTLLTAAELGRLAVCDREGFIRVAADLAAGVPALATLRANLRRQMCAAGICDGRGLAKKIEFIYRQTWKRWCEQVNLRA